MASPIVAGRMIPLLTLPVAGGGRLRLTAYRGRANLALFYFPWADEPAVADALRAIADHRPGYRERHVQPLAIVGGPAEAVECLHAAVTPPFPVLADPEGRAGAALAERDEAGRALPTVLLTDRYGEIRVAQSGWEAVAAGQQPDLLEWLTYIDCLCSC